MNRYIASSSVPIHF